jgi:DNA-binding LacI/PurR family transcriptional regulator
MAGLDGSRYDLVLFNVESPVHRDEHLASLTLRDQADGLLIVSLPAPARDLDRLAAAGVPVVLLDARGHGVPSVVTDDVEGGRIATRHLLSLGHERIAFIGDDPANPFGFTSSAEREQGYRESLVEAGLAERPGDVLHGPHVREVARDLAGRLFDRPDPADRPTAVFAASDTQALGVLEAARARGVAVPDELSVVGFDDIEVSSYAGLTTVRQPLLESGKAAVALLLEALTSEDPPAPQVHQLGLELVVRSTTAPPARARDRTVNLEKQGGSP